jgi:hypothetical protein
VLMVQAARDALLVSATLAATPAPARKTQTQHAEHTQSDRGPSSWCKTHAQLMNEEGSEQLSASRLPSCSWQAALWDAPVYARHSFTHQQEHARRLRWRMAGGGHAVLFACCSVLLRQRQQLSAACMRARSACTCVPSALRARATRPRRCAVCVVVSMLLLCSSGASTPAVAAACTRLAAQRQGAPNRVRSALSSRSAKRARGNKPMLRRSADRPTDRANEACI